MSEKLHAEPERIPLQHWTSEEKRANFEAHLGTKLGAYGYEFGEGQSGRLTGVDALAEGVVKKMNDTHSDSNPPSFTVHYHARYENPDGTFSSGYLFFGAADRPTAEGNQLHFTQSVNLHLEGLEAPFRLTEPPLPE